MDSSLQRQFFYQMLRIRLVEESIARRYSEWEMRCPTHLSIGQEAVAVGACMAAELTDPVMSTHRCHAHYLAKGGNLKAMMAEIYGKTTGCSAGKGGSMHLVDLDAHFLGSTPIVGGSLPVAVGTAFGHWLQDKAHVTLSFFGDGATEEGTFSECLNFAALKQLPVVFVCENNLYSVYSPLEVRQPAKRNNIQIAESHGVAAATGNGNDVEQVYQLTQQAIQRARQGKGPSYLEFSTYRWREHCGPNYDNNLGYRSEAEYLDWKAKCPIQTYQNRLLELGILETEQLAFEQTRLQQEIDAAFDFAQASPFPETHALYENIYSP